MHRVLWVEPDARDMLRYLPPETKKRIRQALRLLLEDPLGVVVGVDVKRLDTAGRPAVYRARIGDWRVAFLVTDEQLRIIKVFHRSEEYGWLEKL